ncbi:hypothetical protein [Microscilla marina]|uniref:STAS/SEC14 domain-containing protein n=1 Tax=Microscilla marina ATCC 23134 TaxID=313606 RepID=A1ZD23_MICM2|nr:hypothetical protein [Microscilla marina]EAY31562.1 hypothetical protein M23134_05068 [Microscilla marina ATCC 23134]
MINTYFESVSATISYNSQAQYMCLQIRGFMKEEDFKRVLLKAREFFISLRIHKVLNDFREFKGTTPSMQEWAVKEYYPTLVKNGLTHGALLLNNDVFAKYAAKNVQGKASQTFEYPAFNNITQAEKWLARH